MAKQLLFNEDARAALKKGIDKLAEAVRMTLGPRGRAVVSEKGYGAPQVTFDGVTVAKEIELEDKFENLGADLIKQAADKTNDAVGDGTTTAVVLAHAMIEEGETLCRDTKRSAAQPIIRDRQIVRSEAPHGIDVVLYSAQIQPLWINIEKPA